MNKILITMLLAGGFFTTANAQAEKKAKLPTTTPTVKTQQAMPMVNSQEVKKQIKTTEVKTSEGVIENSQPTPQGQVPAGQRVIPSTTVTPATTKPTTIQPASGGPK